jgi:predicted RNase H-like HicB family nuclease
MIQTMRKLLITIEKGKDQYAAYSPQLAGIYGTGDTAEEAKESALKAIELLKANNDPKNIPAVLKGDFEPVFHFDTQSLLTYFEGVFTNAALERITGINQRQLQHYASGLKNSRPAQRLKIQNALRRLGSELMQVEV